VGRGQDYPRTVHGVMLRYEKEYAPQEDAIAIDSCRVELFSGDGIRLERVWCFSVRHSQAFSNNGCGIRCRGWDGFVIDCWISLNRGAGFGAYDENNANTLTGNRIEWNAGGGIVIKEGQNYNITGNYIDRSGNAGIRLDDSMVCAITGNVIYRSGKPEFSNGDELDSCHFRLERCNGITFSSNSLYYGRDDNTNGTFSPSYGMVIRNCSNSAIGLNSLFKACMKALTVEADNEASCIIKDNPGTIAPPKRPSPSTPKYFRKGKHNE